MRQVRNIREERQLKNVWHERNVRQKIQVRQIGQRRLQRYSDKKKLVSKVRQVRLILNQNSNCWPWPEQVFMVRKLVYTDRDKKIWMTEG